MGWLNATNSMEQLNLLNESSPDIKIVPIPGINGGQLVSDDALPYIDDYLIHFREWYLTLQPTNEFPKPRILKKKK